MSEALEKIDRGAIAALMSPEEIASFNDDFSAGVAGDFLPQLSIRGGKFRLKIDGEEQVIPGQELLVHLVGSRPCVSKSFYAAGYDPKADQHGPDCASTDGQYPDKNVENPVASNCQICPNNAWGSRGGGSKGKACSDYKQIAVTLGAAPDTAFGLRIPPTSFKPFSSYIQKLKMANVPANAAITKLTLGDEEYPTLSFDYNGLVDRQTFEKIKAAADQVEVQNLIKIQPRSADTPVRVSVPDAKASAQQPVVVEQPAEVAPAVEEAPAPDANTALKDLLAKNKKEKKTRGKKTVEEVVTETPVAEADMTPVEKVIAQETPEEPKAADAPAITDINALLAKLKAK